MENLSPQILRGVLKEMTELIKGAPECIKVHMNDEDITDIQATITGPGKYSSVDDAAAAAAAADTTPSLCHSYIHSSDLL